MANVQYTLFGQSFVESQGNMMSRTFEELLNRHPEKLSGAIEYFTCLTDADLLQSPEALRSAPNAFLNKHEITVDGRRIYVGTSYGLKQKLSLIARLFKLLGEDEAQFSFEQTNVSPAADKEVAKRERKQAAPEITYRFFGKLYRSTQAEMMYRVFETVLSENSGLSDWAAENLNCVSLIDYTAPQNRAPEMPPAFRSCRRINSGEKSLCIGSAYALKAKQAMIDKLLKKANLPSNVLVIIDNAVDVNKTEWQIEAARSAVKGIAELGGSGGNAGIISQPVGTGKTVVLNEIIRRLFEKKEQISSVLLLTASTKLAEQLEKQLKELSDGLYEIVLADTTEKLKSFTGRQNTVVIAVAQMFSVRSSYSLHRFVDDDMSPFSDSRSLLVVSVDNPAFNSLGRIYSDVHSRFPNAVFMAFTAEPQPTKQLAECFGPLLYRYTYEQAVMDGAINTVEYESIYIKPKNEDNSEISEELAELILTREKEQGGCALLLCSDSKTAYMYYSLLQHLAEGEYEIRIRTSNILPKEYKRSDGTPYRRWNGQYFNGIVVAVTTYIAGDIFDTVYLEKRLKGPEFVSVFSLLCSKDNRRKKEGKLIDVGNNRKILNELMTEFPLFVEKSAEEAQKKNLNKLLKGLSDALKSGEYRTVGSLLSEIDKENYETGASLSEQLAFLFPNNDMQQLETYWRQHADELCWKSNMWCALSADSARELETPAFSDNADSEVLQENEEIPARPRTAEGTSQERGALLERETKRLISELFDLDPDDEDILRELRLQTSGEQFGFDITFTYTDAYGAICRCMIECKNYQNAINPSNVVDKLSALRTDGIEVDHWILISPNANVSNYLWNQYLKWTEQDAWYPVKDVQFWTPDQNVHKLFSLFPHIYSKFYINDDDACRLSDEERRQILAEWKERIRPVPYLPEKWRKYLKTPGLLLTEHEADPATVREYDFIYERRAAARLLDKDGRVVDGTAEEYFLKWLNESEKSNALLLGDFGDGKSFFTYSLARRLCADFSASPNSGWIPLRLSLRGVGNKSNMDPRAFLDQRLREFSEGISEWNDIKCRYRCLIILDGFDEMSQEMNDAAVFENILTLERIIEQFSGYKIIVTSRKNVIYSDSVRNRILFSLNNPEILHLAPLANKERIDFLNRLADTPEKRVRLHEIRNTHDLLGLAAKPLFLNMMRAQLEDDNIRATDMSGIYRSYAERVLMRKYKTQLALTRDYTNPADVCSRLIELLEKLALCLQQNGLESISLDNFKSHTNQADLAQLLWDSIESPDSELSADADERITNRSLLKYDNGHTGSICFCHRSMKEYFVAAGIVRWLLNDLQAARIFLQTGNLGYEILEFAGNAVKGLNANAKSRVIKHLTSLALQSRGKQNDADKERYSVLSTNCVNLLHYSGAGLAGEDWSNLILDNAVLSGEDLSGKNLSFSSMKYARMDNADLTGCDLRGCDFTGVRFEKSGQLLSFAIDPNETTLLAYYRDGSLREWKTQTGDTQTVASLPPENTGRLILSDGFRAGFAIPEKLQFWQRSLNKVDFSGYVFLRQGTEVLDFCGNSVLAVKNGILSLINLPDNTIIFRRETIGRYRTCLFNDNTVVFWSEENGLEIISALGNEPESKIIPYEQPVDYLCAAAVSACEGYIYLISDGSILNSFRITTDRAHGGWHVSSDVTGLDCKEEITSISADGSGGIYLGTVSGVIKQYLRNHTGTAKEKRSYRLELKCRGAKIDGVHPQEQYLILEKAVLNQ